MQGAMLSHISLLLAAAHAFPEQGSGSDTAVIGVDVPVGTLCLVGASGLWDMDSWPKDVRPDPYAEVVLYYDRMRTLCSNKNAAWENSNNPRWGYCCEGVPQMDGVNFARVLVRIFDEDTFTDEELFSLDFSLLEEGQYVVPLDRHPSTTFEYSFTVTGTAQAVPVAGGGGHLGPDGWWYAVGPDGKRSQGLVGEATAKASSIGSGGVPFSLVAAPVAVAAVAAALVKKLRPKAAAAKADARDVALMGATSLPVRRKASDIAPML